MSTLLEQADYIRKKAHDVCGYIAGLNPHQFPDEAGRERCRKQALDALAVIRTEADDLRKEIKR